MDVSLQKYTYNIYIYPRRMDWWKQDLLQSFLVKMSPCYCCSNKKEKHTSEVKLSIWATYLNTLLYNYNDMFERWVKTCSLREHRIHVTSYISSDTELPVKVSGYFFVWFCHTLNVWRASNDLDEEFLIAGCMK